jgi:hypothetical protein
MNEGHQVLVKVTEISDQEGQRSDDRVGDVLLVRSTASKDSVHDDLPAEATSIVKIVTRNPALGGDEHAQVIKRALIGNTWIETIEVGVTVPA